MRRFFANFRQVLAGTRKLDEGFKFSFICYCAAFIHLIITCVFAIFHIPVLLLYNAVITVAYTSLGYSATRSGNFKLIFYFSFPEIVFHSVFATLLVGWSWGFMIYIISLVALTFYFTMTLDDFNHKMRYPFCASVTITVVFIVTHIVCQHTEPFYQEIAPRGFVTAYYCFNSFIAFLMCFVFSMLFTLDVRYMQNQLVKENTTLDEIASRDPLTNLLNRRSMENHLNRVMEHARRTGEQFSVIMSDIDDFKKVNDTYGHDCGDKVLIAVSEAILSQMRSEDYLCRWGGEEFLLLIHANGECSAKTAERIRNTISEIRVADNDDTVSITMTFGVSSYIPGYSMNKLIQIADENLYKGKKNGKNQVVS